MTSSDQSESDKEPKVGSGVVARRLVAVLVVIGAASLIIIGGWCRLDPSGFAAWANWPAHEHFLHDAGVFQITIGLMMLAGLWWRDVVAVTLGGFIFTNVLHAFNHWQDRADGGHASDPLNLLVFAALGTVALVIHLRHRRTESGPVREPRSRAVGRT